MACSADAAMLQSANKCLFLWLAAYACCDQALMHDHVLVFAFAVVLQAKRVAIIGSGVSGLAAAWSLSKNGALCTVFEKDSHIGGHAFTYEIDSSLPVDLGFMVFNTVSLIRVPILCKRRCVSWFMNVGLSLIYAPSCVHPA